MMAATRLTAGSPIAAAAAARWLNFRRSNVAALRRMAANGAHRQHPQQQAPRSFCCSVVGGRKNPPCHRPCHRWELLIRRRYSQIRHLTSPATRAQHGTWSSLSPNEQLAWTVVLHYDEDSWEGRGDAPTWKEWSALSTDEKAVVQNGLGVHDEQAWKDIQPPTTASCPTAAGDSIPSLSSLLEEEEREDRRRDTKANTIDNSKALIVAQETRLARQEQQTTGEYVQMAYNSLKTFAAAGGAIKEAGRFSPGRIGLLSFGVGSALEQIPSLVDAASGVLDVTGVDTVIYLDDSCSMRGSNLLDGVQALYSLEHRLKASSSATSCNDGGQLFLPTRILKFGDIPTVVSPSDEDWSVALVTAAWDGSSGGTYMWGMIEDDILTKYRPAGGKLRVVVITDGADNLSPGPYCGAFGFDPLMSNLLGKGYDIEWHIIVVGNYGSLGFERELAEKDLLLYEHLCRATGGQFISVEADGWDENNYEVVGFLDALEDSAYCDNEDRKVRQGQYIHDAREGEAVRFDWLPALLPDGDEDDDDR